MANDAVNPSLSRLALLTGLVAAGLLVLAGVLAPVQFFRAYLFAYCCILAMPLGSLAVLMIQHLTGGGWGVIVRRPLEAAVRTLPVVAVMFLPIAIGVKQLYPWAADPLSLPGHKWMYLNPQWFLIRAGLYFAVWIGMGWLFNHWSARHDQTNDEGYDRRFRLLAAPGLGLYGLSITFASIDWVMSLEPEWFSSIYGVTFGVGQILGAFAFAIIVVLALSDRPIYKPVVSAGHRRDLGSLMLAFTMIWTYFSLSQLILIWSANLKEETPYYIARTHHGWQFVAIALASLQFVVPFLVLLTRDGKRDAGNLMIVAGIVLAMRFVDYYWLIAPARPDHGRTVFLADLPALVALAALWLALYLRELGRWPLLPRHVDPSTVEDHHV